MSFQSVFLFEAVTYFYLNGEIPVIVLGNQDDGTMIGARHNHFLMTQFKFTVDSNITFFYIYCRFLCNRYYRDE